MEYIHAALLLHKVGKEVNEHNLKAVVSATGVHTDESKIKSVIASLKDVDIDKEIENSNLVVAAPSAQKEHKKEEVKEEKKEATAEGLSALFG